MIRIDVAAIVAYLLIGYGVVFNGLPWWVLVAVVGLSNRVELSFWLPGRRAKAQKQIEDYIKNLRAQQMGKIMETIPVDQLPSV